MPKSKEILSSNDDLSEEEKRVTKKRKPEKDSESEEATENSEEVSEEDYKPTKKAKTESKGKAKTENSKPAKGKKSKPAKSESEASENEDEESEEEVKDKKKAKTEKNKKKPAKAESDDEGEGGMYKLSAMRFISVSEFRGKPLINIREYYEKDGKKLPGNKGISLTPEQWTCLKKACSKIDKDLEKY